ncbi:MAG: hypothetical protein ACREUK_02115 [Burkholderiales bacterium]
MKVVVLGAGVVGVTTAWYLAEVGHDCLRRGILRLSLACGSGRALTDLVSGRRSEVGSCFQ